MFVLMEPVPPPLTPEHIDSLFALLAEAGAVGLRKVRARMEAAETDEAVERMGRSLQAVGRYLRQTLALKLRFDREQASLATERRREAEVEHQETQRVHDAAVVRKRKQVCGHFERVLWNEYEHDDAKEFFDGVQHCLDDLAEDGEILDTPLETLILRVADQLGLLDNDDEDEPEDGETLAEAPEAAILPAPVVDKPTFGADRGDPPPEPPPPSPRPEPDPMPWERGIGSGRTRFS